VADKIVYLVSSITEAMRNEPGLAFVDDADLSGWVSAGWEVVNTIPREVQAGKRKVKATMIVLRRAGDNRGVSTVDRGHRHDDLDRPGNAMVTVTDDFGRQSQITPASMMIRTLEKMSTSLANLGDTGHLGGARNHNIPGLQIISSEVVQKAFDVGLLAQRRGEQPDACPFPSGSEAAMQWLRGYRTGEGAPAQKATQDALDEAYRVGHSTAKLHAEHDVVTCPYPAGSPLRPAWVKGFTEAGGRVEG
jgi:ribosome modulation factor